jgi:predicted transcriptional regulator
MRDCKQLDLFSKNINISIKRISRDDAILRTDRIAHLEQTLFQHENLYPGINRWYKNKVLPGIKDRQRIAYVGYENDSPIVSAVVKKGENAKFCHLHINSDAQGYNLGDLFFSMMATDVRGYAKSVYFTLPADLWDEKTPFFNSFGFVNYKKAKIQYRTGLEEFYTRTYYSVLWENVLQKLPKIISALTPSNKDIFTGILISIKPKYIDKIASGEKIVEIRRRFNSKWNGCIATLYSSKPIQALIGQAKISKIRKADPQTIWEEYEGQIGAKKEDYDNYTNGATNVYAVTLSNFKPYMCPMDLQPINNMINRELKPPQSYLSIGNNRDWIKGLSLAQLMHKSFDLYCSTI